MARGDSNSTMREILNLEVNKRTKCMSYMLKKTEGISDPLESVSLDYTFGCFPVRCKQWVRREEKCAI